MYLQLPQLKQETAALTAHAFHPGMPAKHARQAQAYIRFCDNYNLQFIYPQVSTIYYVTHLTTTCFSSAKSIRNYICGVRFLHKQLSLTPEGLDSFPCCVYSRLPILTCTLLLFIGC